MAAESTVEDGFPGLFADADRIALERQRRHFRVTLAGLIAGLVAAVGSAISRDLTPRLDLGGLVAGTGFLAGAAATVYLLFGKADRAWYEARAATEAIRTLAWQYCVRGGALTGPGSATVFRRQVRDIARTMQYADLPVLDGNERVTAAMDAVRAGPPAQRRALYLTERVDGQYRFYLWKARYHRRQARTWLWVMAAFQIIGLFLAVSRSLNLINADVLGIAATAAAAALAWVQTKDSQNLAESYRLAAGDLAVISSESAEVGADEWAAFVRDAEQAMLREHGMWRARRTP